MPLSSFIIFLMCHCVIFFRPLAIGLTYQGVDVEAFYCYEQKRGES